MILRRVRQLVLALWVAAMIGAFSMAGAAFINDYSIHSNPGRALATVTGVDWLRTNVQFQDEQGIIRSPKTGLLYPSDLAEGQQVWVTYAKDHPELVTVEGRRWTLSIIPALSVAAVGSALAGGAWWLLGLNKVKPQSEKAP